MKKYIILTGLLFALAFCGIGISHTYVNHQKDKVDVNETILFGNREKADGIQLSVEVQSAENLLNWQVNTLLEDSTKTTTVFGLKDLKEMVAEGIQSNNEEIKLNPDFPYGGTGTSVGIDVNEDLGKTTKEEMYHQYKLLPEMVIDAAAETPNDAGKTTAIQVADYIDNFALVLEYANSPLKIHRTNQANGEYLDYTYFHIPVPEDFYYDVEIEKNTSGRITFYGACPSEDINYRVDASGLIVEDTFYLAISGMSKAVDYDGTKYIDFADIEIGQRGIHCIPLVEQSGMYYMDFDHAYTALQINENEKVLQMLNSEDQKTFYLFTEEEEKLYLSVIDRKTMKRVQKLAIGPTKSNFAIGQIKNNSIIAFMRNGDFVLLTQERDVWEIEISNSIRTIGDMNQYSFNPYLRKFAWDYDGNRLAIAAVELQGDERRFSDCILQVFDQKGLQYAGLYENSLQGDMLNHGMEEDWLETPVDVRFVH